jgi:hypothetical protein
MTLQSNTPMRISMAAIACVTWLALLVQFPLSIATSRSNGMNLIAAILAYFSFFTILTNILVCGGDDYSPLRAQFHLGRLFLASGGDNGDSPLYRHGGAGYSLLLRYSWNPEGLQEIGDILLHDAVPVMYVVYWLIFGPKRGLRRKNVPIWSIYPLAYLFCVLVRGALTDRYPYPFIDASALGYSVCFATR